jgi:hypothetical protein
LLVSTMDSGMELICQFHPCSFLIMVPGMLCIQNCQVANSALSSVAHLLMQLNGMPPYGLLLLTIAYKICLSAQFGKSSCQVAKDKLFWDATMGLKDRQDCLGI